MKKLVISLVLFIILGFVIYQIIVSVAATAMMLMMSLSFIPLGFAIFVKYLFYFIGALILFKIVSWAVKD